jgi:ATP adenylyltransferase
MDHLWAPWRLSYVSVAKPPAEDCFLCRAVTSANLRADLVAHRTKHSLVVLNRFPYNNGHLLIAPRSHKATLEELTAEELFDGVEIIRFLIRCIDTIMKPDGYNVGLNLGRAAGAGLPGHLHWHLVPRWNGDTNFMTTVAEDRVIVQSLDTFWQLLSAEIARRG